MPAHHQSFKLGVKEQVRIDDEEVDTENPCAALRPFSNEHAEEGSTRNLRANHHQASHHQRVY